MMVVPYRSRIVLLQLGKVITCHEARDCMKSD